MKSFRRKIKIGNCIRQDEKKKKHEMSCFAGNQTSVLLPFCSKHPIYVFSANTICRKEIVLITEEKEIEVRFKRMESRTHVFRKKKSQAINSS